MPRSRPPTSGYARIAQAEEEEEEDERIQDSDEDDQYGKRNALSSPDARYAPIQPQHRERMPEYGPSSPRRKRPTLTTRKRTNSGVDIKAINARLEKWADEIAQKFKIRKVKGKTAHEEHLEIHHSVFQAPDWIRPATANTLVASQEVAADHAEHGRLSKLEFDDIVESVRTAIDLGMHPKLIAQGSSGSYFARNTDGKVVGVFKPKDEEPYANKNPKWTKWIHRNLFPFAFGRACLIPNLSYVSEAAAYILDSRLQTNLVPYTDVVGLSSKSFFYDYFDRRAYYRKKKPLPEKLGSFQVFLKGYKDATLFLKEHPWPDQTNSGFRTEAAPKPRSRRWAEECRPGGARYEDEEDENLQPERSRERSRQRSFWTDALQQSFREQLERLVILDYIMRNTDRGLDNWMIRIDEQTQKASIVIEPPKRDTSKSRTGSDAPANGHLDPYDSREAMSAPGTDPFSDPEPTPVVSIGAIDNSLSWPWKHPDAWRSFPFGWLFLPVSLIGRPFSENTKQHFLPLLCSNQWWSETQVLLRRCFERDSDFQEKMFARQIAVMKGQAWNVVETLKTTDHGPLELTRRTRVCVWDDLVDIPIASPMRTPSAEMRRKHGIPRRHRDIAEEEEMDISAAHASAPTANGSQFDSPRQLDFLSGDDDAMLTSPASLFTPNTDKEHRFSSRPVLPPRSQTRLSYEEPRKLFDNLGERRRRFSLAIARRPGENEADGDLGYSAAEDQEGNQRKVIVERLETVKSKNPVFTWC